MEKLTAILDKDSGIEPDDIRLTDVSLGPGYGRLNDATVKALQLTAQCEGLFFDPVYTAKTIAGLFHFVQRQKISGNVLF